MIAPVDEIRLEGHVTAIRPDEFDCELRDEDGCDVYEATIRLDKIQSEDRFLVTLGAVLYLTEDGVRFSRAVWTQEEVDDIKRRARELMSVFGTNHRPKGDRDG